MKIALTKTELSPNIQQQPTATRLQKKPRPQKEPVKRNRKKTQELTSQSVESAQPSARRNPEHNTGTADSKRARLAAEQQPAG